MAPSTKTSSNAEAAIASIDAAPVPVSAKTTWIVVSVTLADGTTGWGEATLFGAEEAVLTELGYLAANLVDRPVRLPGEALAAVATAHLTDARRIAVSALEQALTDVMARQGGMPLASFLGGPYRRTVPCYANINRGIADRSPDGFAAQARAAVTQDGYRAVKIAPFDGLHWSKGAPADRRSLLNRGLARIGAVRDAIGPETLLLIDCHARLSPPLAGIVVRETAAQAPYWIEEPMATDAFDPGVRRQVRGDANVRGTRIAGGETLTDVAQAAALLADGTEDAILPDLRWTGIQVGMAMLRLAVASGVEASLHNPVGPVLDRVSLHVAAALPSFSILERQVRETPLFDALTGMSTTPVDGALPVPDRPGIGIEIDGGELARAAASGIGRAANFAGIAGAGADA